MVLRRGDRGPYVAAVRVTLASLGLLPPDPHADPEVSEFDDATDRAVRTFQQQRGLLVDGLVGPVTVRDLNDARWSLGDRTLSYTLSAPMTGDDVIALQTRLLEMGYNTGRPDGVFGFQTDLCVREYQRSRGLPEDGVFGPDTFRDLTRIGRMVTGGRPVYLREYQAVRRSGPRLRGKRIVIDPAHGAEDPGWSVERGPGGGPLLRHRAAAGRPDDGHRHVHLPDPRRPPEPVGRGARPHRQRARRRPADQPAHRRVAHPAGRRHRHLPLRHRRRQHLDHGREARRAGAEGTDRPHQAHRLPGPSPTLGPAADDPDARRADRAGLPVQPGGPGVPAP